VSIKISEKKRIPAVEGVFTWPSDDPHFIASRCKTCGTVSFPKSGVCRNPKCKNKLDVEEILLSRRGKLMTYTQINYQPPPPYVSPEPFIPFAIGEAGFPEGIAILGQLTGCKYEDLEIGMEVEMVVEKLFEDKDGNEVVAWKFRPV
jgi:uncharacterized OB-fold protein